MSRLLFYVGAILACAFVPARVLAADVSRAGSTGLSGPTFRVVAKPVPRIEAPADEYFGRYRLSSLSVRTAISDMTIEGNSPLALPLQLERIAAVRSALPDWANRYPHDPWVPDSMFKFAEFLIGKQEPAFDPAAYALLTYLEWVYPRTWYAEQAKETLADFEMLPDIDLLWDATPLNVALVRDYGFASLSMRRHR